MILFCNNVCAHRHSPSRIYYYLLLIYSQHCFAFIFFRNHAVVSNLLRLNIFTTAVVENTIVLNNSRLGTDFMTLHQGYRLQSMLLLYIFYSSCQTIRIFEKIPEGPVMGDRVRINYSLSTCTGLECLLWPAGDHSDDDEFIVGKLLFDRGNLATNSNMR